MANDFSGDNSTKLLYKLDTGGLLTDSIGSNTLTNVNTVTQNTTNPPEGTAFAVFNGSNALRIFDTNLDSGVPYKTGETNRNMTVCIWFVTTDLGVSDLSIAAKYDSTGGYRSWRLKVEDDDNSFRWAHGYNSGGTFEQSAAFGSAFVINRWYHGAFTLDENDNYTARIWDDTAGDFLDTDMSATFPNATSIVASPLIIGSHGSNSALSTNGFIGGIDECVIFDEIKSTSDTDLIRQQTYPGAGGSTLLPIMCNQKKFIENNTLLRR